MAFYAAAHNTGGSLTLPGAKRFLSNRLRKGFNKTFTIRRLWFMTVRWIDIWWGMKNLITRAQTRRFFAKKKCLEAGISPQTPSPTAEWKQIAPDSSFRGTAVYLSARGGKGTAREGWRVKTRRENLKVRRDDFGGALSKGVYEPKFQKWQKFRFCVESLLSYQKKSDETLIYSVCSQGIALIVVLW